MSSARMKVRQDLVDTQTFIQMISKTQRNVVIFFNNVLIICEHGMDFDFGCDLETNSPKIFSFVLIIRPSLTGCRMQNWYIFTLGYFWYIVEMGKICAFS